MNKKPQSQQQEVLLELIKTGSTDRRELMNKYWIMNAPDVIMRLRRKGVEIDTIEKIKINKFGREISYGEYVLINKEKAIELYKDSRDV